MVSSCNFWYLMCWEGPDLLYQDCFQEVFPDRSCPSYERLKNSRLKCLEYRHVGFDLILWCKIVNGFTFIQFYDLFSWARVQGRPNSFQLVSTCSRKDFFYSFAFRIVRVWNNLAQDTVSTTSPKMFSRRLMRLDLYTIKFPLLVCVLISFLHCSLSVQFVRFSVSVVRFICTLCIL